MIQPCHFTSSGIILEHNEWPQASVDLDGGDKRSVYIYMECVGTFEQLPCWAGIHQLLATIL